MKSLERRFKKVQKENPALGDYFCFARAVRGGNFSKKVITCWFNKLVPEDDYAKSDKKYLLGLLLPLN